MMAEHKKNKYTFMDNRPTLASFLENAPLYKTVEIDDCVVNFNLWYDLKFQFHCNIEKERRTFKVIFEPEILNDNISRSNLKVQNEEGHLNYIIHVSGICQSCEKCKAHFLINVFSDIVIEYHRHTEFLHLYNRKVRLSDTDEEYNPKFFLKKVGQLPAYSIKTDKEIYTFLQEVNRDYYTKALICISQGYGIAAYAYLRRIVETEVTHIVEFLIEMETTDKEEITKVYEDYRSDHQMDKFLQKIDIHLPIELKAIHPYPLRILYSQLSIGIHSEDEDSCLSKAELINELLNFIIKGLNTRKNYIKNLAPKMKGLERK